VLLKSRKRYPALLKRAMQLQLDFLGLSNKPLFYLKSKAAMKHVFPFLLLLLTHFAIAQDSKSQLELTPFIRYDAYPEVTYQYGNRTYADDLEMKGLSWGAKINYKYLLGKNFRVKAGAGYYRYRFNDINSSNIKGNAHSRPIDYPTPIPTDFFPGFVYKPRTYYTDRYWYNCLSWNIGLEKAIPVSPTVSIFTSVDLSHYYTFSQGYHIDDVFFSTEFEPAITNGRVLIHKVKEKQFFGYGGSLQLGLTKSIQKYAIGPSLLLPVFDTWRKDELFRETATTDETRTKGFGGLGLAIAISRNL
jgi:hypothetical protein